MTSSYELPLFGGVVQAQRLIVPTQVVKGLESYRHACRMAWKLRSIKGLTRRTLAEHAGLYATHVSDYFSVKPNKRSLPAEHIAAVERVLGNTVISQYQAGKSNLTVLEEMQVARRAA
jgi:hypothetical protein